MDLSPDLGTLVCCRCRSTRDKNPRRSSKAIVWLFNFAPIDIISNHWIANGVAREVDMPHCPSDKYCRRLQGIQDRAEEGAEILEHFEFEPADPSKMDRHELVK